MKKLILLLIFIVSSHVQSSEFKEMIAKSPDINQIKDSVYSKLSEKMGGEDKISMIQNEIYEKYSVLFSNSLENQLSNKALVSKYCFANSKAYDQRECFHSAAKLQKVNNKITNLSYKLNSELFYQFNEQSGEL